MGTSTNVGIWDRFVRISAGVILIAFAVLAAVTVSGRLVSGILGIALVITGGTGYCPLYDRLGSTRRRSHRAHP
jgi:DUF2892 family protein